MRKFTKKIVCGVVSVVRKNHHVNASSFSYSAQRPRHTCLALIVDTHSAAGGRFFIAQYASMPGAPKPFKSSTSCPAFSEFSKRRETKNSVSDCRRTSVAPEVASRTAQLGQLS